MAKARKAVKVLGGCLLLAGTAATAQAAPTAAQMLGFKPKHDNVQITTPTAAEVDRCKVELVKEARGSGWLLKDASGQPLRRYFDANSDNKIDIWSYYYMGQEVYREIDSNSNDKVDQYRWFNTGGSKWGIDANEDGKIDTWRQISPEEISQEVLRALVAKDYSILQALMPTDAELALLPTSETARIKQSLSAAPAKFQTTVSKLPAGIPQAKWIHVEMSLPQAVSIDGKEFVKYPGGSMLYQVADKSEWVQIGELVQIGQGYRVIDAPVAGMGQESIEAGPSADLQPLLLELQKIDEELRKESNPPKLAQLYFSRANVLERIIAKCKPAERDQWVQQLADCLNMVVQNTPKGDQNALKRLTDLREQTVKASQGSNIAAYVTYCELTAENFIDSQQPGVDAAKVQKAYIEKLAKFVQDYPKADNTADALMQLGMLCELAGEEGQAKKWFEMLHTTFPSHMYANKAKGAVNRLSLRGKELTLTGMVMGGGAFDIRSLKNKYVVVYYWASWNGQSAQDFAKLKELMNTHSGKLAVVCVNLDDNEAQAKSFLLKSPAPGTVLFEQGGQNSRLADLYGVVVLPTLFLVDKDGKVLSHNLQMGMLEDELKRAMN